MSSLKTQAPKMITVVISLVLVLIALLGATVSPAIADNGDWLLLIGYIILVVGVFVKGV
ncbi:hypothetical protein [Portibacter marinus]|uniref:hypothetical protein n=1 Tax=Portibacter marinus TaxID=2898660 RepID=UPI001F22D953|nr:hypothetical protein [Portibacter marinus]